MAPSAHQLSLTEDLVAVCKAVGGEKSVMQRATDCLIDWMGCAIAGGREVSTATVIAAVRRLEEGKGGPCSIVGSRSPTGAYVAALVNGTASHSLDVDDVNQNMLGHPGVVVIPAALATAELSRVDG